MEDATSKNIDYIKDSFTSACIINAHMALNINVYTLGNSYAYLTIQHPAMFFSSSASQKMKEAFYFPLKLDPQYKETPQRGPLSSIKL